MEPPSPKRTTHMVLSPSRSHSPRSNRHRSSPRKRPLTPKPNQNVTPPHPHKYVKLSHPGHIPHHGRSSKRSGSNTTEAYTVCKDHELCEYVGLEEFLDVLKFVQDLAVAVASIMKGEDYIQWIYSQEEVGSVTEESDIDWIETCRYCWLAEFLRGHASHVWLVGLKIMGKNKEYSRSISCMKADGDETETYEMWIKAISVRFRDSFQ